MKLDSRKIRSDFEAHLGNLWSFSTLSSFHKISLLTRFVILWLSFDWLLTIVTAQQNYVKTQRAEFWKNVCSLSARLLSYSLHICATYWTESKKRTKLTTILSIFCTLRIVSFVYFLEELRILLWFAFEIVWQEEKWNLKSVSYLRQVLT